MLDAPRDDVFAYLSSVDNLPEWATDFAKELKYENGKAKVVNALRLGDGRPCAGFGIV